jgi:hypothetical protein
MHGTGCPVHFTVDCGWLWDWEWDWALWLLGVLYRTYIDDIPCSRDCLCVPATTSASATKRPTATLLSAFAGEVVRQGLQQAAWLQHICFLHAVFPKRTGPREAVWLMPGGICCVQQGGAGLHAHKSSALVHM